MDTSTVTQEGTPIHDGPESGRSRTLAPAHAGGFGGECTSNKGSSDLHMLGRALRGKWPIPEHLYERAIQVFECAMSNPETTDRDRVYAVKALAQLEAQNMEARGEKQSSGNTTYNTVNILAAGEEAAKQLALLQGQPLPPPPSVQSPAQQKGPEV